MNREPVRVRLAPTVCISGKPAPRCAKVRQLIHESTTTTVQDCSVRTVLFFRRQLPDNAVLRFFRPAPPPDHHLRPNVCFAGVHETPRLSLPDTLSVSAQRQRSASAAHRPLRIGRLTLNLYRAYHLSLCSVSLHTYCKCLQSRYPCLASRASRTSPW